MIKQVWECQRKECQREIRQAWECHGKECQDKTVRRVPEKEAPGSATILTALMPESCWAIIIMTEMTRGMRRVGLVTISRRDTDGTSLDASASLRISPISCCTSLVLRSQVRAAGGEERREEAATTHPSTPHTQGGSHFSHDIPDGGVQVMDDNL